LFGFPIIDYSATLLEKRSREVRLLILINFHREASTIDRQIVRPIPMPLAFVVKNASKSLGVFQFRGWVAERRSAMAAVA
jgi:hypothetical protein